MSGLLPCLGHIAWINGDGQPPHPVLKAFGRQVHVEAQPVEVLAECLPVTLLRTASIAPELKEIDLSRYAHD